MPSVTLRRNWRIWGKILGAEDKDTGTGNTALCRAGAVLEQFIPAISDRCEPDSPAGLPAVFCHRSPRKQLYPSVISDDGCWNTPGDVIRSSKQLPIGEVRSQRCDAGQQYAADNHHYRSNMAGKSALLRQTAWLRLWRKSAVSFRRKARISVWWTRYSHRVGPATISPWASLRLWWRWTGGRHPE